MALVQAYPQVMAIAGDLLVNNMDWPDSKEIAKRLKKMLPPQLADEDDQSPEAQLVAAVKTYIGEEKAWDVQLVLKRADVPATRLGQNGRMGLTTWMGSPQQDIDADQVVLKPVG